MKAIVIVLSFLLVLPGLASAQTTHVLTESMGTGTIRPSSFTPAAQPGDTIIISADRTSPITLQDFDGTPENPYIITNPPDSIARITSGVIGILVKASDNFKIFGNNYPGAEYGIEITGVTMSMRFYQCADWEVGYTYQHDIGSGLHHNRDDSPYSPAWDSSYSLGDCRFHHNLVTDTTSTEGLYLGHSKIDDGSWARFDNLEVDNNKFYNIMWEAFQTAHVDGKVTIHDNFIQDPSMDDEYNQNKGFDVGVQVAEAEVYGNTVIRSRGHGIYFSGTGNTNPAYIHDNIVIETGLGDGTEEDAIKVDMYADGNRIEDNILLKCGRQCIRANKAIATYSGNIMGEAAGVLGPVLGDELIDGGGNVYESDIDDIGFAAWSDDGDYSNDDFSFPGDNRVFYIEHTDTDLNGQTFCDGPCTGGDTLIIRGGTRGGLKLKDFRGNGDYITIINENTNPDSRVVMEAGPDNGGWGIVTIQSSSFLDFRGDGDPDIKYGIKIADDGYTPSSGAMIRFTHDCDDIKVSYIEMEDTDWTTSSIGINIGIPDDNAENTYSNFEIHHNYVHHMHYCGMYLGRNQPLVNDDAYITGLSLHDNIFEDIGGYGITHKGVSGGVSNIYNNTFKRIGLSQKPEGDFTNAIGTAYMYNGAVINIFDNWIEDVWSSGIKLGSSSPSFNINVYRNIIIEAGKVGNWEYGNGIRVGTGTNHRVYDNIIIKTPRYGVLVKGAVATAGATVERNLVTEAGYTGWEEYEEGDTIFGTGENENVYYDDTDDVGFVAWSDDGDYTNDIFEIGPPVTPPPEGDCGDVPLLMHFDSQGDYSDSSGNGNHGSCINCPSWTSGRFSGALEFDGIDDMVTIPADPSLEMGTGDMTISVWVRLNPAVAARDKILNKGGSLDSIPGYYLQYHNTYDDIRLQLSNGVESRRYTHSDDNLGINDGTWHHIAAVLDRSSVITFYVDGAPAGTYDISSFDGDDINNPSADLNLGNMDNANPLNGGLDDVAIWSRVLSAQEIQDVFGSGSPVSCSYTHPADTDTNGCIETDELGDFIGMWYLDSSSATLPELMDAVGRYKAGTGC